MGTTEVKADQIYGYCPIRVRMARESEGPMLEIFLKGEEEAITSPCITNEKRL